MNSQLKTFMETVWTATQIMGNPVVDRRVALYIYVS